MRAREGEDEVSGDTVGLSIMTMVILLFLFYVRQMEKSSTGDAMPNRATSGSSTNKEFKARHDCRSFTFFENCSRMGPFWNTSCAPEYSVQKNLQSTRYSVLLFQSTRARTPTALPECRKRHVCTGCKPFQIRFPPTRSARSFCMHPGDTVAVSSQ